jgi:hypothetical protein
MSLAELVMLLGATTAGGAIVASTVVWMVGMVWQALIPDWTVPVESWAKWGARVGAVAGLFIGLYEFA